jgi:ribonucleoside-diphosphate reductase alpha chain
MSQYGPTLPFSDELHATKYRSLGESFEQSQERIAAALADNEPHRQSLKEIFLDQRFLPGGRIQSAVGSPRNSTPYNCFVSGKIEDSMEGIMDKAKEAALTMRMGGGIGYDFSVIRPRDERIASLDAKSSGPVSFMHIYDAVCSTVSSAGNRRGAQMGVLRVDHPDIEEFIFAKRNKHALTNFNISVGITDKFMEAVENEDTFDLVWDGRVYRTVDAVNLWEQIMRSNWDWAEPGVLFLDTINNNNNLWYCETISATNPCAEQPLPPYGACLLGSFNLVKYILWDVNGRVSFDWAMLDEDIQDVVRAMDNVVDIATYPLPEQEREAKNKRRMGLGITGLANTVEALGFPYGSREAVAWTEVVMEHLTNHCYSASSDLAKEKGSFPFYDEKDYCNGVFFQDKLPSWVQDKIRVQGIRNSHLISIAPTGTISLTADNVSSGIEPPFRLEYDRIVKTEDGDVTEGMWDYALLKWNIKGKTAADVTIQEHLNMLLAAQKYCDSAVSKTLNVPSDVTWDEFQDIYRKAWEGGAKGCTTFREAGKRGGILISKVETEETEEGSACYLDPDTGEKSCD